MLALGSQLLPAKDGRLLQLHPKLRFTPMHIPNAHPIMICIEFIARIEQADISYLTVED